MADVAPGGSGRSAEESLLLGALIRAGVALIGVFGGLGALGYSLVSGHGVGLGLMALLYVCTLMLVWGITGFTKTLSLGVFGLLVISAAVYGVLFLVGYLVLGVAGPFVLTMAGRFAGYLHLGDVVFFAFAAMAVGGAAGCAFSRNIIYSAWSLLFAFMGVAGLYVFLGADFPAVAQVLIYVGGILVLILFAIMLTKQIGEDPKLTNAHVSLPAGALLGAAAVGTLSYMAVMAPWRIADKLNYESTAQGLGVAFLTDWLLPFEVASVVLLTALIGSVVIARKEIKETSDDSL
jgi:NAD(P)H-quinone oxidoreductase subunit 6